MNQTIQPLFPGKAAVKVFYLLEDQIEAELIEMTKRFFPSLTETQIEKKCSANQKYTVITFDLYVEEEMSLKELYKTFKQHPKVTMVL